MFCPWGKSQVSGSSTGLQMIQPHMELGISINWTSRSFRVARIQGSFLTLFRRSVCTACSSMCKHIHGSWWRQSFILARYLWTLKWTWNVVPWASLEWQDRLLAPLVSSASVWGLLINWVMYLLKQDDVVYYIMANKYIWDLKIKYGLFLETWSVLTLVLRNL